MTGNLKFEVFLDACYYDLWCVRPVGDTDFNSTRSVHFPTEQEARTFHQLAEKGIWAVSPEKKEKRA